MKIIIKHKRETLAV